MKTDNYHGDKNQRLTMVKYELSFFLKIDLWLIVNFFTSFEFQWIYGVRPSSPQSTKNLRNCGYQVIVLSSLIQRSCF